jgi:hypothetical protein
VERTAGFFFVKNNEGENVLKQKALCSSGRVLDAGERRCFFFKIIAKKSFFFINEDQKCKNKF